MFGVLSLRPESELSDDGTERRLGPNSASAASWQKVMGEDASCFARTPSARSSSAPTSVVAHFFSTTGGKQTAQTSPGPLCPNQVTQTSAASEPMTCLRQTRKPEGPGCRPRDKASDISPTHPGFAARAFAEGWQAQSEGTNSCRTKSSPQHQQCFCRHRLQVQAGECLIYSSCRLASGRLG